MITSDPMFKDQNEKLVSESDTLVHFVQSEGGKVIVEMLKDEITRHMNRIADSRVKDPLEISRLAGGIRFGEEVLKRIFGKINMGRILKERQAELENLQLKRSEKNREKMRIPTANYARDAV